MNPVESARFGSAALGGIRTKAGPSTMKEETGYAAKTASRCSITPGRGTDRNLGGARPPDAIPRLVELGLKAKVK
jgi:hypothetical protein